MRAPSFLTAPASVRCLPWPPSFLSLTHVFHASPLRVWDCHLLLGDHQRSPHDRLPRGGGYGERPDGSPSDLVRGEHADYPVLGRRPSSPGNSFLFFFFPPLLLIRVCAPRGVRPTREGCKPGWKREPLRPRRRRWNRYRRRKRCSDERVVYDPFLWMSALNSVYNNNIYHAALGPRKKRRKKEKKRTARLPMVARSPSSGLRTRTLVSMTRDVDVFLQWCAERGIEIDSRLTVEVTEDDEWRMSCNGPIEMGEVGQCYTSQKGRAAGD